MHRQTRGNPMSRLHSMNKCPTKLAQVLVDQGFTVSARSMLRLAHRLGYLLQANAKTNEGRQLPDPDAQFGYIKSVASKYYQPVISIDTKNRESLGNLADRGREWEPEGMPMRVEANDLPDRALGEFANAIPCNIFDFTNNKGWVSVGESASPPVRTPIGPAPSKSSSRSSLYRWGWTLRSGATRRGPRGGSESSTGCSTSSP